MAVLNSTAASVHAQESVFALTDMNARTGKKGEGGGETDSKVLRVYERDVLKSMANYCWVSQKTTSSLL